MSGFVREFKSWINAGLGLIYPECCQLCHSARATPAQGYVCSECCAKIRFVAEPFCDRCGRPFEGEITTRFECGSCREMELHFESARSAVLADDLVRDIIHRYKYQRHFWFEPILSELLVSRAAPELAKNRWDFIVPTPLHSSKYREREFNQAERLSRKLSEAIQVPLESSLLQRVIPTRSQTLLNRAERVANVRNAFSVKNGRTLSGERIVVVDDVFTTGATTSACARALMRAGAGAVCVWTVARGT